MPESSLAINEDIRKIFEMREKQIECGDNGKTAQKVGCISFVATVERNQK